MSLIGDIHLLDQKLTLQINSLHCVWSDHLWQFFSDKEVWFPMYLVIAVLLIVRLGWKKGLVAIASIIATIVACDQFSNLIKDAAGRLRPCHDPWMLEHGVRILEGKGNLYGFFSAHAANSFGFAVSSLMAFGNDRTRRYTVYDICIILWALLVAASRIFVGKHFLGDVLVGTAVGILFGWFFGTVARRIICKNSRRIPVSRSRSRKRS